MILTALISLFYIYEDTSGIPGSWPKLALLWGVIAALVLAARRLPVSLEQASVAIPKWNLVVLGCSGIIPLLSLLAIAGASWPLWAYFAAIIFWVALYRFLTRRFAGVNQKSFGWFGLGWYLQIGTFSWLGIAAKFPYMIVVDTILFALLWWIVRRRERLAS
jgi:hypothetical protein